MSRHDLKLVLVIGVAVGVLSQPILGNIAPHAPFAARVGAFLGFTALAPFALWCASLLARLWKPMYEFAKFSAVGSLNFFIDAGILNILMLVFGITGGIGYSILKTLSFLGMTTNSFFWNKHWTFGAKEPHSMRETALFYSVAFVGGAVNVGVASYVVNGMLSPEGVSGNVWANIGAVGGILSGMIFDFLGYKFVVFRKRKV